MSDSPRVAIVHYHLKRGGVTRVIESTLDAFQTLPTAPHCAVLAGEVPDEVAFHDIAHQVDGLEYSNAQAHTPSADELVQRLTRAASKALGGRPDIWHIHNHSLGKNSAMPGVIAQLAQRGDAVLLHMHDFAEDGRPENHQLNQQVAEYRNCLYPAADHVHYAVLNARDHAIFTGTGIPSERLHLLANPVEVCPPDITTEVQQNIRDELAADQFILYPVRAVRRKNFGEMLYWAALADPGTVFANTLGPTNINYQDAYLRWQTVASKQQLPIHFGTAHQYDWSFDAVMQSADAILSTSIAEGFGLAFLEPWLYGKCIAGRDLPDITADFKTNGLDLSALYDSIPIPDAWVDVDQLQSRLDFELHKAYNAYQRPLPTDALERALDSIRPAAGLIDFAGLEEAQQETIIERISTIPETRQDLPRTQLQLTSPTNQAARVRESYSFAHYAQQLSDIYQTLLNSTTSNIDYLNPEKVVDAFLLPERFRLLRT